MSCHVVSRPRLTFVANWSAESMTIASGARVCH